MPLVQMLPSSQSSKILAKLILVIAMGLLSKIQYQPKKKKQLGPLGSVIIIKYFYLIFLVHYLS